MSTRFIEFQRIRQRVEQFVNIEILGIFITSLADLGLFLDDEPPVNRYISPKPSAMDVTPAIITPLYVVVLILEFDLLWTSSVSFTY